MNGAAKKKELDRLRKQAKRGGNAIKDKIARGELPKDYFKTLGKGGGNKKWHGSTKGKKVKSNKK